MNTDVANSLHTTEELRLLTAEEIGSVAGGGWMPFLGLPYVYTNAVSQTAGDGAAQALGLVAGGAVVAFSSASSSTGGAALGSAIAAIFH